MEGLLYTPNTLACMLDVRGFGGGAVEGDLSLRGFVYGWGFRAPALRWHSLRTRTAFGGHGLEILLRKLFESTRGCLQDNGARFVAGVRPQEIKLWRCLPTAQDCKKHVLNVGISPPDASYDFGVCVMRI